MKEIITAPIISTPVISTPVRAGATSRETIEYLIYFLFGLLEVLLGFRLVLKLAGASTFSSFVRFVYALTGIFIMPFQGIFRQVSDSTFSSVLEPAVIVAIFVYIFLAWGVVKMVQISSGERQES